MTPKARAKHKAWKTFSLFIRTRDSKGGYNTCVTCGARKLIKELHAGHWLPGRHNAVLFDERNCHPQCYHCNVGLKGNPVKYFHFMEKTYGKKVMEELEKTDTQIMPMKAYEFIELYEKFKKELGRLDPMNDLM